MTITPYLIGGAQTDFARNWSREGKTFLDVLRAAVEGALDDAGLDLGEVARLAREDRVQAFVGNFQADQFLKQAHLGAFLTEADPAFHGVPSARYEAACASGSVALDAAATKIRAGDCDLAVVVGIEVMRNVPVEQGNDYLGAAAVYEDEARGVPFVFPVIFGRLTDRILARANGAPESRILDALSEISRTNFANAKANPNAQTRAWDVSPERMKARDEESRDVYGGRTRYSDCCQVTDGAAAVLLASPRYAK
ncbi:MAG: thiolase domain-containing protein, partial [Candidatus Methylomirabilis sp.]|nr:thiolase domain-containing protein [Deltaproteobacteria bacterium]